MKKLPLLPLITQKLIWLPTRVLLNVFGKLQIFGLQELSKIQGNVIFAMNHSSEVDPFIVPASLPFFSRFSPVFYATREKEFYDRSGWRKHLFGGRFINAFGGYGVIAGLHDYEKSLSKHLELARNGGSFCYFPEGRITDNGKVLPAKGGIAYMTHKTDIKVIPVTLSGAFGMSVSDFFMRRRTLKVFFGEPFEFDFAEVQNDIHAYKKCADLLMSKIQSTLDADADTTGVL